MALVERVGEAQARGERLRIVCQTNAERSAVKTVLRDFGVDKEQVSVHSFGARFAHGPREQERDAADGSAAAVAKLRTRDRRGGARRGALLRHELARLRARVHEAEHSHEAENNGRAEHLAARDARCVAFDGRRAAR